MGMDVYGKNPENETGRYFRNNVWWWRPLWDYCVKVAKKKLPEILEVSGGTNDGDGFGKLKAQKLAHLLRDEIESGRTEEYSKKYAERLKALPLVKCDICNGTGKRNDQYLKGKCNACDGKGKRPHWETSYPFSTENVKEFADFLEFSGGFEIC